MICRKLWVFLTISSDSIFRVVSPPLLRMHCRLCLLLILATTNFSGRAAVFTVTTTNSAGTGSLQQAILDANTNPGADTIQFYIPEPGFTISPVSALPALTDQAVIDGSTQPGFGGIPLVELSGNAAGANADGLRIFSSNCIIRSLVINRFTGSGILLATNGGNLITGCFIGTGAFGTNDLGNSANGIRITNSANNTIGGLSSSARNVISGNNQNGVLISGAQSFSNLVAGNLIGLTVTGSNAVANNASGIFISGASANQVGGTNEAARNVISGNNQTGVRVEGSNAIWNVV